MYLLESPRGGVSNKYIKRMIHKKKYSKVSVSDGLDGLHSSKFDFTAKSLVTNTVVIRRVLCIWIHFGIKCLCFSLLLP